MNEEATVGKRHLNYLHFQLNYAAHDAIEKLMRIDYRQTDINDLETLIKSILKLTCYENLRFVKSK